MTHADATRRAAPGIPPSDCPGALRRRRLRPRDWAWKCERCGVTLWFDGDGQVVLAALNGTPILSSKGNDASH